MTDTATQELEALRRAVRTAWEEALGHSDFGDDDAFFTVSGGHSLTALQVMATLSSELGSRLPVRLIFRNKTVHTLTVAVAQQLADVTTDVSGPQEERK